MNALSNNANRVVLASLVNLILIAGVVAAIGAPFVYPLDDAYIHLSIARTIAHAGVWGIDRLDPASASSSPLYSVLLAGLYSLAGTSAGFVYVPLAVNGVASILCLILWTVILSNGAGRTSRSPYPARRPAVFGGLLALSIATPVFGIVLVGMEHTLQIAIVTALLYWGIRKSTQTGAQKNSEALLLLILSMLAMAVRYESALVVAMVGLFALLNRKFKFCLALTVGSLLPLVAFGELWVHAGGWMVPNTILMKRIEFAGRGVNFRVARPTVLAILLLDGALLLVAVRKEYAETADLRRTLVSNWRIAFAISSCLVTAGHLFLGIVGWLYRYEAMLISVDLMALYLLLDYPGPNARNGIRVAAGLILCARLLHMSWLVLAAPHDRQWEHVPVAQLIARFYKNQAVVVNDVGLAAWSAPDVRILDLTGLANNEMAALRMSGGGLTAQKTLAWAQKQDAKIAVLQICWDQVYPYIPPDWTLVSIWHGPRNVVFRDLDVGFFGTTDENAAELRRHLAQFPVPEGVQQIDFDDRASANRPRPLDLVKRSGCTDAELARLGHAPGAVP